MFEAARDRADVDDGEAVGASVDEVANTSVSAGPGEAVGVVVIEAVGALPLLFSGMPLRSTFGV